MSSIKLKRIYRYYGALRTLHIEIDHDKMIPLGYAEERVIDLPSGTHTLIAKMDWVRSLPLSITVAEDQSKQVVVDTKWLLPACIATLVPPFTVFSLSEAASWYGPTCLPRSQTPFGNALAEATPLPIFRFAGLVSPSRAMELRGQSRSQMEFGNEGKDRSLPNPVNLVNPVKTAFLNF